MHNRLQIFSTRIKANSVITVSYLFHDHVNPYFLLLVCTKVKAFFNQCQLTNKLKMWNPWPITLNSHLHIGSVPNIHVHVP